MLWSLGELQVGRGCSDLVIDWPGPGDGTVPSTSKHVIECKVVGEKSGLESVVRTGREQLARYMERCGAESGHLVIFDMREGRAWKERLFHAGPRPGGLPITVWGM